MGQETKDRMRDARQRLSRALHPVQRVGGQEKRKTEVRQSGEQTEGSEAVRQ
jgi:hypothetical protein